MTPAVLTDPVNQSPANGTVRVDVRSNGRTADSATLPAAGSQLMEDLFARLSAGQVVTLIPEQADITIDQAADVLLASKAFVTQLIDQGEVPPRGTDTNPLVRYADVMAFKRRNDAKREAALAELTGLSQDMGLY